MDLAHNPIMGSLGLVELAVAYIPAQVGATCGEVTLLVFARWYANDEINEGLGHKTMWQHVHETFADAMAKKWKDVCCTTLSDPDEPDDGKQEE